MGSRPADGVAMGQARKRGKRATGGCKGRQKAAREGERSQAGRGESKTIGRGRKIWVTRGLWSGPRVPRSGRGGGGPQGLFSGGKPRVGAKVWGWVDLSPDNSTRHEEGGGVELSQDNSTLKGRGRGVESWQNDRTQNGKGRGVESSKDDSNPREGGGSRGDETLGALTAS